MQTNFIPEKIVQDSVEKILKRYKISEEKAEEFFLEEAFKNKRFMENVLEFSERKNFGKWREYRKVIKKTKKNVYYFLRQYKHEPEEKIKEKFSELRKALKKEGKLEKTLELHKELLAMHISSKERTESYKNFYEKIFRVTGKPESVLDVSCGFNYFSILFMKLEKLLYAGTEFKKEFVEEMNQYFLLIKNYSEIKAKGFLLDLRERDFETRNELLDLNKGKEFDVAFLLKLIPVMEREKRGSTNGLIEAIPAKWLVLSVSKESMTKKEKIAFKEVKIIKNFIKENNLYLNTKIDFENEIVFITKKE